MKSTDYAHTMHSVNASFKALERLNRPPVLKWIKDQENHFSDQPE
jgi:hypothetical protein